MNPTSDLFFPKIQHINKEFVERIKEIRSLKTFEVPDDFVWDIKRWTFENIASIALDKEFGLLRKNRDDSEIVRLFQNINRTTQLSFELDVMPPVWKFIGTANSKEMMTILDEIQATFEKYVNEAIQTMNITNKEEDQSVLQKLVAIDRKLASVIVMDMMLAGLETVGWKKSFKIIINIVISRHQLYSPEYFFRWEPTWISKKS